MCTSAPPSSSARDLLAGRRLHQRRAAQENRPGALHDHRLVRHRRHVRAARGARAHHDGDLRNPLGRHARLVEEDAAEVLAIGEHLRLQRQERAARVHQVHAGQAILERHLLRAHVLLHGHRVVRAALHGGVVGDDDRLPAGDAADAGDDARPPAHRRRTCRRRRAATARETASRDRAAVRCARGPGSLPCWRCRSTYCGAAALPRRREVGRAARRRAASMRARLARNSSLEGSTWVSIRSIRRRPRSPAAAVRLVPAVGAAPHGVHAVHVCASAALAHDRHRPVRSTSAVPAGSGQARGLGGVRHESHYR